MDRQDHKIAASWVFRGLTFLFLVSVFVLAPEELPAYKQRILALLSASLAGFFAYFFSGTIGLSGSPKIPLVGKIDLKATGSIAVFAFMLLWWFSDFAPVKVQGKSAVVPFFANEDIHLGDNVFPERWGYTHNPLNMSIYPQRSAGLVYFDKKSNQFISGADNQTHIGLRFVEFFRQHITNLDFSGYQFVSSHVGTIEIPDILKKYMESGRKDRIVKLGPTFLYTNENGQGNFYERYAAVAIIRAVDFTIPLAQAGMEFSQSTVKRIEFLIECYHGGLRPGQTQNFALMLNGHAHEIATKSLNMREKEVVRISIPLSDVNFLHENITAIYVMPWQENGPKSVQSGEGPVHFRDVGIVNAYFVVTER